MGFPWSVAGAVLICYKIHYEMKGYLIMSNKTFVESKTVDKSTLQSKYKVGNSVYIVNSNFAGTEDLKDLLFNIFCKKAVAYCSEKSQKA